MNARKARRARRARVARRAANTGIELDAAARLATSTSDEEPAAAARLASSSSDVEPAATAQLASNSDGVEAAATLCQPARFEQLADVCRAGDAALLQSLLSTAQVGYQQQELHPQYHQQHAHHEIVNQLNDAGHSLLHDASGRGHSELIPVLIHHGASVNGATANRWTALHFAARYGHKNVTVELLVRGADSEAAEASDFTALHLAAKYGHKDVVEALLTHGANVDSLEEELFTPLHLAAKYGHKGVVIRLLAHGANIEAREYEDWTPLHFAARYGHEDVVDALLVHGANVEALEFQEFTPLHLAAKYGHKDPAVRLLKHGANIEAREYEDWTPLHFAARYNHKDVLTELLLRNANVNAIDKDKWTSLHFAARFGHKDVAIELLVRGADSEAAETGDFTALHLAAKYGHKDVVEALLTHGANVDSLEEELFTPLHLAAKYNHKDVAVRLLAHGASIEALEDESWTPLHFAARYGFTSLVTEFLLHGANVDAVEMDGFTPLHFAAMDGYSDIMHELLSHGANADAIDNNGWTSLRIAVRHGHFDIVSKLLSHGANINARSTDGCSALHIAAQDGRTDVVAELLAKGANVDAVDVSDCSPLHFAAQYGRQDVATQLLLRGASIRAIDKDGWTSLHFAVHYGHKNVVLALLSHGASVDVTDASGATALHIATKTAHTSVVSVLLTYEAKVTAIDNSSWTPLHFAARFGQKDAVMELLAHGASVDAANESGWAPLHVAVQYGHSDVVTQLLVQGASVEAAVDDGSTPLHLAARFGHNNVTCVLLAHLARVNAINNSTATPLHVAAMHGHKDVALQLLRACSTLSHAPAALIDSATLRSEYESTARGKKSLASTNELLEMTDSNGDTPVLAAARGGHFETVIALLDAGASAHARATDGETLLVSAARHRNQRIVSELISRGSVHASAAATIAGIDCLLLLSVTMLTLEVATEQVHEFAPLWLRVVNRLQNLHTHLSAAPADSTRDSNMHQFVLLICHLIRLKPLCSDSSAFARLVASQAVANRLRDLHTELAFLESTVEQTSVSGVAPAAATAAQRQEWESQCASDERDLLIRFRETIERIWGYDAEQRLAVFDVERDAVPLLQHKVMSQGSACSSELLELLNLCLAIALQTDSNLSLDETSAWFIPEHDLDIASVIDELAAAAAAAAAADDDDDDAVVVRGKWSNSAVIVSQHTRVTREAFVTSIEMCNGLNHPNVVKLFGASHLRDPFVAVYESVASTSLCVYLAHDDRKHLVWQKLYEVALGLAFLVDHGVVVETIRCDDIWVGTDGLAKVNAFSCLAPRAESHAVESDDMTLYEKKIAKAKVQRVRWKSRECIRGQPATAESVVYSLAMCVLEALTGKIPWSGECDDVEAATQVTNNHRPSIPGSVSKSQQNLIEHMWRQHPLQRPTLDDVCHRLRQFADESEEQAQQQRDGAHQQLQLLDDTDLDTRVVLALQSTIPAFFDKLERRWTYCTEHRSTVEHILARSHNVFALLQTSRTAKNDTNVGSLCNVLLGLDRFLRFADKTKSLLDRAKSQRAALRSNVFHFQLDELLKQLASTEIDPVHEWRRREDPTDVTSSVVSDTNALNTSTQRAQSTRAQAASTPDVMTIARFQNDQLSDAFKELDFGAIAAAADAVAAGQTDTAASPQLGTQLPWLVHLHEFKYQPHDKIGMGSFGEVFKAAWKNTVVVVKFMGYEHDDNTLSRELFFHELRVWFPLNHPHVARLFGACHVGKRFFVCEFLGGGTLDSYLRKQRTAQHTSDKAVAATTWRLLHQVTLGLQYLHERNVLHNDLKCDNVLIGAGGNAKLIDFGLSSILLSAEMRVEPKYQGAVHWRSPEYLRGDRLTLASDVYAFGMLLLEAVTGTNPWGNAIDATVKYQVRKKGSLPPQPACLSAAQWMLIRMMCASESSQRVKVESVVDKLHEFAQQAREEHESEMIRK